MKEYNGNFTLEYKTAQNILFYMQTLECKSEQTLLVLYFGSPSSALQPPLSKQS